METNAKTFTIELTEPELIALSEGVGLTVEEAAMVGNDPEQFNKMAKAYLKANPADSSTVLDIVHNYNTLNNKMLQYRSELLRVVVKAEATLKQAN